MIINFALSLSFEGIELLHRVQRGWRRIGRVEVASETLDEDLADLRKKGEALATDGFYTKLIIPLDQIKYTAIDSTMTTQADIDARLEDATPYALDDLVVDCERFGGRTHIAAVARETLKEAEVFAAGHGFNPVAFVAVPEPFTFQKEVFFGPSELMPSILGDDAQVHRDDLAVMIVGTRIKSRLLVFDLPKEVEEEVYKDDLAELLSEKSLDRPEPLTPATDAPEEEEEEEDSAELEQAAEPVLPTDDAVEAGKVAPETAAAPLSQEIWVDHIPSEYHAPQSAEEVDDAPSIPIVPENPTLFLPPLLDAVITEFHPATAKTAKAPLRAVPDAGSMNAPKLVTPAAAANRKSTPSADAPSKAPLLVAVAASAAVIVGGLIWSQQQSLDTVSPLAEPTPIVADNTTTVEQSVEAAVTEALATASSAPTPEPDAPLIVPLEAGLEIPEITITAFGTQDTDGGALPAFAELTTVKTSAMPQPLSVVAADAPLGAVQAPPPPPEPEVAQAEIGAPVLRGTVLSPAEADRIYQATGVWQRSPRFIDTPSGVLLFDFTRPSILENPTRIAQPEVPPLTGLDSDLSFLAPADPPPPTVFFQRDEDGFILATPEGTLTPDGALVIAGLPELDLTLRPTLTQEQLNRMALLAPAPEGVILIAGRPQFATPLRPADAQLPEAPEEAETADVTDVADAITEQEGETAQPSLGGVGVAGLELQNSGTIALDPSVVENASTADLRPLLRPQEFEEGVDVGTPDITDIIAGIETDDATLRFDNSTQLAVVLSIRPDVRPNNFTNVVAAAQARQVVTPVAPSEPTAPVAAAAPVPPQNFEPVPGGVARAATQEDIIRLRDINLIGVYGRPNARRALVRLSNGRYVRVEIGSALDGGQVTAIGDDALNYVKRGRTYAIELPSG